MRKLTVLSALVTALLITNVGCQPGAKREGVRRTKKPPMPQTPFTAENNPTTLAGRGQPDLEDEMRAAAWVFIDGWGGHYTEVDGHPQVQWIIEEPVCSTPTFQVEVYEPLVGEPTDFQCALKTLDTESEADSIYFGIRAKDGTFKAGTAYSLVSPGEDFVIRDPTGGIIDEIGPLAPGRYLLAAGVKSAETQKEALAVTYFTVGAVD